MRCVCFPFPPSNGSAGQGLSHPTKEQSHIVQKQTPSITWNKYTITLADLKSPKTQLGQSRADSHISRQQNTPLSASKRLSDCCYFHVGFFPLTVTNILLETWKNVFPYWWVLFQVTLIDYFFPHTLWVLEKSQKGFLACYLNGPHSEMIISLLKFSLSICSIRHFRHMHIHSRILQSDAPFLVSCPQAVEDWQENLPRKFTGSAHCRLHSHQAASGLHWVQMLGTLCWAPKETSRKALLAWACKHECTGCHCKVGRRGRRGLSNSTKEQEWEWQWNP